MRTRSQGEPIENDEECGAAGRKPKAQRKPQARARMRARPKARASKSPGGVGRRPGLLAKKEARTRPPLPRFLTGGGIERYALLFLVSGIG